MKVQHDLGRSLSLTASATFSHVNDDGVRLKKGFSGSAKLDHRLTRSLVLRESFTHGRLKSTNPGSDETANICRVALRFDH